MVFTPCRNCLLRSTIISRTIHSKRRIRKNYWGFVQRHESGTKREGYIEGSAAILVINHLQTLLYKWDGNHTISAMTLTSFFHAKDQSLNLSEARWFPLIRCSVRYKQESNFRYRCTASSKLEICCFSSKGTTQASELILVTVLQWRTVFWSMRMWAVVNGSWLAYLLCLMATAGLNACNLCVTTWWRR